MILGKRPDVERFLSRPDAAVRAALIYGRRQHMINLFTWPGPPAKEASQTRNGYQLESWPANGMIFWAVSDLNEAELRQFISLYRQN